MKKHIWKKSFSISFVFHFIVVITIGAMARNYPLLSEIVASTPDVEWIICKSCVFQVYLQVVLSPIQPPTKNVDPALSCGWKNISSFVGKCPLYVLMSLLASSAMLGSTCFARTNLSTATQ